MKGFRFGELSYIGGGGGRSHLLGYKVIISDAAMSEPTKKPLTDDMVAMVEHLRHLGEVRQVPCMYRMGSALVVHPSLSKALQKLHFNSSY